MLGDYYDPETRRIRLLQLEQQFEMEKLKVRLSSEGEMNRLEASITASKNPRATVTRGGEGIYCVILYRDDDTPQLFSIYAEKTQLLMRLGALGCRILSAEG